MPKLEDINYETRIKIARAWIQDKSRFNSICKDSGLNSTSKKNVGPLYDQYGKPGLRDTSMTRRSNPSKIDPSLQELIITIMLNHPHLTTKEVRNLLWAEGLNIDPAPIQRFLTQAGLGTEELRNQYLEELRGLKNSRSTRGLQKFAYKKFGTTDDSDNITPPCATDEYHYLLFNPVTLNPRKEPGDTAALYVFLNLSSFHIGVMVIDCNFLSREKKLTNKNFNEYFLISHLPLFTELFLWYESLTSPALSLQTKTFIYTRSHDIDRLNKSYRKLYGDSRLSIEGTNKYLEHKINFKVNSLVKLKEVIKSSKEYNSQEDSTDQVAYDYSIDKVQEFVNEYNAEVTDKIRSTGSPQYLDENRNTRLLKNPVVKYSMLLDEWLDRNEEHRIKMEKQAMMTKAELRSENKKLRGPLSV
jgi:transposase